MEELFSKYIDHYKKSKIEIKRIAKDGIINPELFSNNQNTNQRILFILKETNDFDESTNEYGGDLRILLREKPWKTISIWAAAILERKSKELHAYKDIEKIVEKDGYASRRRYIERVAVINLKKASGVASSDGSVINAYTHQDNELLLEQIDEYIKPSIIIAGGTLDYLIWLLDLNVNNPEVPPEEVIRDRKRKAWIVPTRHPSHDPNPTKTYERICKLIEASDIPY
jgi:hypothetical protein